MKADHKEFEIELSEAESTSVCSCCGSKARVVRGFVYGDDFGSIYLANLYVCHPGIYVCLALGIGDWSEEAEETARCSVTLGIEPAQESLGMQIIDPAESPWVESQRLIGRMLDRGEAFVYGGLNWPHLER